MCGVCVREGVCECVCLGVSGVCRMCVDMCVWGVFRVCVWCLVCVMCDMYVWFLRGVLVCLGCVCGM